jgi:spermidine/putrescine transport system permease protein
VALVFLLLYAPLVVLVALSFNGKGEFGDWTSYSLGSYLDLFRDLALSNALRNTIALAAVTTVIATGAGAMLALGIHRVRRGSISGSVAYLPIVLPDIVVAVALLSLFVLLRISLGFHSLIIAHGVFGIGYFVSIQP